MRRGRLRPDRRARPRRRRRGRLRRRRRHQLPDQAGRDRNPAGRRSRRAHRRAAGAASIRGPSGRSCAASSIVADGPCTSADVEPAKQRFRRHLWWPPRRSAVATSRRGWRTRDRTSPRPRGDPWRSRSRCRPNGTAIRWRWTRRARSIRRWPAIGKNPGHEGGGNLGDGARAVGTRSRSARDADRGGRGLSASCISTGTGPAARHGARAHRRALRRARDPRRVADRPGALRHARRRLRHAPRDRRPSARPRRAGRADRASGAAAPEPR